MDYEDIVVGSGVSALGAVLGAHRHRRILVLAGHLPAGTSSYPEHPAVPCAYDGPGGLGNFWHGVIPTGMHMNFDAGTFDGFGRAFEHFYPKSGIAKFLGTPHLFVPSRPIRPLEWIRRIAARPTARVAISFSRLVSFRQLHDGVCCSTSEGRELTAGRLWIGAGTLHTPVLLERSLGKGFKREHVSDHITCYLGQLRGIAPPALVRTPEGIFFPYCLGRSGRALYTVRPARFDFRQLDRGVLRRLAMGLPTSRAIARILRSLSPGLVAEALYTRYGRFPRSDLYNVFAQVPAADAYEFAAGPALAAVRHNISAAVDIAHQDCPFTGLIPTHRPDLYIPGIHLHHSVAPEAIAAGGLNGPESRVHVVDASPVRAIGPEHHSFKLLEYAQRRASAPTPSW